MTSRDRCLPALAGYREWCCHRPAFAEASCGGPHRRHNNENECHQVSRVPAIEDENGMQTRPHFLSWRYDIEMASFAVIPRVLPNYSVY